MKNFNGCVTVKSRPLLLRIRPTHCSSFASPLQIYTFVQCQLRRCDDGEIKRKLCRRINAQLFRRLTTLSSSFEIVLINSCEAFSHS